MKWAEHIKQFPELEKRWNQIPEATKSLFEIQIDAYANGLRANKRNVNHELDIEFVQEHGGIPNAGNINDGD